MEKFILYEQTKQVVILTLNRPERLNSFVAEMHKQLSDYLEKALHDDDVKVIILTGTGKGFCAGQDLNTRKFESDQSPDLGESLRTLYNPLMEKITTCDKPVIAAVNGVAAGAGANIALSCDIVIASASASFIQAFSKIGLIPDCGGTWLLPKMIGLARAKALMMLGDKISAAQAHEWGMIWQVVPDDNLMNSALELANKLTQRAPISLKYIKQAIDASHTKSYIQQLELEAELQYLAGKTQDYKEGVLAFREKRPAIFKNK